MVLYLFYSLTLDMCMGHTKIDYIVLYNFNVRFGNEKGRAKLILWDLTNHQSQRPVKTSCAFKDQFQVNLNFFHIL